MQGVPVNRLCTLFVSNSDHRSLINRILVTGKNASSSSSGCTKCTTHSEGSAVGKSQPIWTSSARNLAILTTFSAGHFC